MMCKTFLAIMSIPFYRLARADRQVGRLPVKRLSYSTEGRRAGQTEQTHGCCAAQPVRVASKPAPNFASS